MVLPALIGGIGSAVSGIFGASAANNAAAYNYQVDLLNYYQREQERQEAIQQARRTERDQKLGGTDAQGNRVRFVEGVGWVTELSDAQQQLQDLYQQEELAQLTQDLPMRRRRMEANDVRQDREGNFADRTMDAMARRSRASTRDIEAMLNQASTHGITQGFDSALEDGMRNSLRTGSNAGKVDAQVGQARADALAQAFLNNRVNARSMSNDEYMQEQGNMANLYNLFATRASAMPDVSFQPQNIGGMTGQQQGQFAQMAQSGAGALINAFANQGGSMPRVEPNYGTANAIGQASNAFTAGMQNVQSNRQNEAMQNAFMQYVFGGQQPNQQAGMLKQNTGVF